MVLSLQVSTSLWVRQPFHGHRQPLSENTGAYIVIHNSSKITVTKQQGK